jgi:hypothetical protein
VPYSSNRSTVEAAKLKFRRLRNDESKFSDD